MIQTTRVFPCTVRQELTMAIGFGIGLFLIVLGIACEFAASHREAPSSVGR